MPTKIVVDDSSSNVRNDFLHATTGSIAEGDTNASDVNDDMNKNNISANGSDMCDTSTNQTLPTSIIHTNQPLHLSKVASIGTVPYTIFGALDEEDRRRHKIQTSAGTSMALSLTPIDVIVAILSVSIDLSDRPTATLLVTDPSLPHGTCARIKIYGSGNVKMLSMASFGRIGGTGGSDGAGISAMNVQSIRSSHGRAIGRGDIVRFNRVDVASDHRDNKSATSSSTTKGVGGLNTVICEFRPSWRDPEAGIPFARVGLATSQEDDQLEEAVGVSGGGEVVPCDELPGSMTTPVHVVRDLLSWFEEQHTSLSKGQLLLQQSNSLGSCRRRKLRDITRTNTLSDVVVSVISCDSGAMFSPSTVFGMGGKRRKRNANATPQTGYVARLSDGNGHDDIMPFYNCQRFKSLLESASSSGSCILVTRVLSQHSVSAASASSLPSVVGSSAIVLLPTADTTIVVLSDQDSCATASTCNLQPHKSKHAQVQPNLPSQFWDSQSQLFAQAQHSQNRGVEGLQTESLEGGEKNTRIVQSTIMDVFIDECNVCLTEGETLKNTERLVSVLVKKNVGSASPQYMYRNATITLDSKVVPDTFIVKADGNIMEALCCGCTCQELCEGRAGDDAVKARAIRQRVCDIISGFIYLDVELRWTLRKDGHQSWWTVTEVSLPTLAL